MSSYSANSSPPRRPALQPLSDASSPHNVPRPPSPHANRFKLPSLVARCRGAPEPEFDTAGASPRASPRGRVHVVVRGDSPLRTRKETCPRLGAVALARCQSEVVRSQHCSNNVMLSPGSRKKSGRRAHNCAVSVELGSLARCRSEVVSRPPPDAIFEWGEMCTFSDLDSDDDAAAVQDLHGLLPGDAEFEE